MSGAHGSGIRSLADVKLRCEVDEITGCWKWSRSYNYSREAHHRTAVAWFPLRERVMSVARIVAILDGKPLHKGWRAWNTCNTEGCCNPEHIRTGTSKMWGDYMARAGRMNTVEALAAKARIGAAKAKVSDEQIAEILASNETHAEIAKRYGVVKQTISKIRAGHRRMRMAPGSSVFAWR